MSEIKRLIEELCPEGVEWKKLGEVAKIMNGKDYKTFPSGNIPVFGTGGIMTYIDTYVYDKPSVLLPRKGSIDKIYYVDVPFWTVDTIYWTKINDTLIIPKFLYFFISTINLVRLNTGTGAIPSLTQAVLNKIEIPVPPLPVQSEIVRILDKFTSLEAELEAELEARRKQYEYYRNELLSFHKVGGVRFDVKWVRLGDVIISLNTGLNPRKFFKLNTDDAENYYITIKEIKGGIIMPNDKTDRINDVALRLCNNRSNLEKGDVLFSGTGTIGETAIIEETPMNWNIKEGVYSIKPKQDVLSSKYLRYILMCEETRKKIMNKVAGGTVQSIPMKELKNITIPVPPLSEQQRIVSILDRFEALTTDLQSGLPAEIAARRQQYEYYRNRLLTFKRKVA